MALTAVIGNYKNLSLQDRQIDAVLKESNEYMDLLKAFNASFKELQERDREKQ
jgi:hypothetical protein